MTADQYRFFTTIYQKRRKQLLEYAESVLCDHALAEDAVQQAFEIGWRKIGDFQNSPNPDGWIFRVTKFVISNLEDRQRTERRFISDIEDHRLELLIAPDTPLPLYYHFGDLVEKPQFRIIYEREIQGRTLKEIAQKRGINEAACRKRIERAKKDLKKTIKNLK